jgi:hypothetical protein
MALINDPNVSTAATGITITTAPPYEINREWCLGDSLFFINKNFDNIDTRVRNLSTTTTTTNNNITSLSSSVVFTNNNQTITGQKTFNGGLRGQGAGTNTQTSEMCLTVVNNGGTGDTNLAGMTFNCSGTYATHLHLRNDSYIGFGGYSASAWRWYLQMTTGDMTAAGDITAFSDIRLKENIQPITSPLEKIKKLNGVSFNWKKDMKDVIGHPGKADFGILAHEVEEVLPEIVHGSPHEAPEGDKYKTVAYDKLVPVLLEAVKELSKEIEELKVKLRNKLT